MKVRVIGLMLAAAVILSVTLTAFATTSTEKVESPVVVEVDPPVVEETAEAEQPRTPFYLNAEPMEKLVYQVLNHTNYITVESFVAALDCEAMVEEEDGLVIVNAASVVRVVNVGDADGVATYEAAGEANVEEETLNVSARSGDCYVVANGRYLYVENGVIEVEGSVALPVRVLAKIFNLDVAYDGETGRVYLTAQEEAAAYLEDGDSYYDNDLLYWLSHIIHAESGNQCLEGKLAVGNVVMNRLEHPDFPDTIYDVLFQRNQFSPAGSGSIYRNPNAESVVAAKLILDGAEVVEDALFFNRAGMNTRAARTRPFVATIGAHSFYA